MGSICSKSEHPERTRSVFRRTNARGLSDLDHVDIIGTRGCSFPRLDPFAPEIRSFITDPSIIDCSETYPDRFRSNFHNQIIPVRKWDKNETCCYKTFIRQKNSDNNLR